ncbi:GDSL esterase/lipase [Hibiscus syriacus]|uniref:GDSL esterase/lipase n=1 Tax=Hibiscus syriacus TaxID=106335 RepID=A0A6A2Y472_HIBSY|nr:GDSL esterase/lipase [Hibiscus syriacus]
MAVAISILLVASLLVSSRACHFPAIYNLGDSNADTGSVSATFGRVRPPYGETFFCKPAGRYSDGRLIIDFIADELKLPFLSAYLDATESNFSHGANFAASGSTIQPANGELIGAGFNPLSLDIQLLQFQQLKDRTNELYNQAKNLDVTDRLPRPNEFSKALYTLDCGQNDLNYGLITTTEEQVKASIPNIIIQFATAIEKLYQQGARMFWIHNTGPIGCLPVFVINSPPKPENADQTGCIKSYNELAQEFNKQLKDMISRLRTKLHGARLTYVDIYSAKYSLISEAHKYGFVDPFINCCGRFGDYHIECGKSAVVNGTEIFGASCSDPSKHISWDGIHYTEAANHWILSSIKLMVFKTGPFSESVVLLVQSVEPSRKRISMEVTRPNVGTGISGRWNTAWASKNSIKTFTIAAFFAVAFSLFLLSGRQRDLGQAGSCYFPAVFNFGDSNSDTAENLGLPYLSAYLDSISTNFRHGANFATGGSTIQPLDARMLRWGVGSNIKSTLPRPEDFSQALYTFDIGQIDLDCAFKSMAEKQVIESIPEVINEFAQAVKVNFHLFPFSATTSKRSKDILDTQHRQLKESVIQLRMQFPDAALTYVDIYSAKYSLISDGKHHGYANPLEYCCGHYRDKMCWRKNTENGTATLSTSCSNPSAYISWDGIHYSHAANLWIANKVVVGWLSDPPTPITKACHMSLHSKRQ